MKDFRNPEDTGLPEPRGVARKLMLDAVIGAAVDEAVPEQLVWPSTS
jgi:hypothetical protein